MGVLDTIRNFFSGKGTKKKVSKEAMENALRRFARFNKLKYRPGMAESAASYHASRSKRPRADDLASARSRLKALDNVMREAKKTGDNDVTGVVLAEFGQILKEILAKMVEKDRGNGNKVAGQFANLIENAAPTLAKANIPLAEVKAAVLELKAKTPPPPALRPASHKTPKVDQLVAGLKANSPAAKAAQMKEDSFHSAVSERPASWKSPKSPTFHDQVKALMKKKNIPAELHVALANWLTNEDTIRTRAAQAEANAKRAEVLRENAANVYNLPGQAIQVTRKAIGNQVRGLGDLWRRTTRGVRGALGYKRLTPDP